MDKDNEFDYIIVGLGLAGSALCHQMLKRGKKILVFDHARSGSSSRVAAGLYNPVTGRKMVKSWKAELLFPYLTSFYKELEELCGEHFLVEKSIYRPFISLEEQNEWMGKSASEGFEEFVKKVHHRPFYSFAKDPFGGIELKSSGYLNTSQYLNSFRAYLERHATVVSSDFDYNDLHLNNHVVDYQAYRAGKIIFCDGLNALQNSYFSWLPFKPVKGEVLQVNIEIEMEHILNRGVFVIPLEGTLFKVGSNYDNNDQTTRITEKAREEITGKLRELINVPFEVVMQEAGLRPASKDRRPFVGMHPEYETIGVLNGLGAKGVSLAPYFSEQLAAFLEEGKELDPQANISRYFSLYYDSL